MAGYAILHLEKRKTMGDIKRLIAHIERTGSEVSNAKPPYDSRVFKGSGNMLADIEDRFPKTKIRSNAVLAVEFMLTVSPETLRVNDEKEGPLDPVKVKKFEAAMHKFLNDEFGGSATARIHFDETTPHGQGFFVPNDDWIAGNPLNAKKMSNPLRTTILHTKWQQALVNAGLDVKRGEPGSQATHQAISEYYGIINRESPTPPELAPKPSEPTTSEKIKEAAGIETDHSKAVKRRNASKLEKQQFFEKNYKDATVRAANAENETRQMRQRAERAEAKLLKAKNDTNELRSLPLSQVLETLGCERHKDDRLRWKTPAGDVWIEKNGPRFNSFDDPDLKGRGAIDLVMKINGQKFDQAASWLAGQFGHEATAKDAAGLFVERAAKDVQKAIESVPEPTPLPTPEPTRLERVAAYLEQARAIPLGLVSKMIEQGRIYADKFANVCFKTDTGNGVEMRGTAKPKNGSVFHSHRGPKDGFTVEGDPKKVAIVESAIEALSLNAVNGMTAVSVGGSNLKKSAEIARAWIAKGAVVFAAQNDDQAGEKQANALIQAVPDVHRLKPLQNDWNDVLKAQKDALSANGNGKVRHNPMMNF